MTSNIMSDTWSRWCFAINRSCGALGRFGARIVMTMRRVRLRQELWRVELADESARRSQDDA